MRILFSAILFTTVSLTAIAQENESTEKSYRWGASINTNYLLQNDLLAITPSATFYINRHQLELGPSIYPFIKYKHQTFGGDLVYRFFPNGVDERFSLYFSAHLNYTHDHVDYHYLSNNYQTTSHNISLTGGYGFQARLFKGLYVGLNPSLGANTYSYHYSTSNSTNHLFNNFDLEFGFQLSIGYRF